MRTPYRSRRRRKSALWWPLRAAGWLTFTLLCLELAQAVQEEPVAGAALTGVAAVGGAALVELRTGWLRSRKAERQMLEGAGLIAAEAPGDKVYAIAAVDDRGSIQRVKIGYTSRPVSARLAELDGTSSAERLTVLAVIAGGVGVEKSLHRRFAGDRTRGDREWFNPTWEVLRWVADVSRSGLPVEPADEHMLSL